MFQVGGSSLCKPTALKHCSSNSRLVVMLVMVTMVCILYWVRSMH